MVFSIIYTIYKSDIFSCVCNLYFYHIFYKLYDPCTKRDSYKLNGPISKKQTKIEIKLYKIFKKKSQNFIFLEKSQK